MQTTALRALIAAEAITLLKDDGNFTLTSLGQQSLLNLYEDAKETAFHQRIAPHINNGIHTISHKEFAKQTFEPFAFDSIIVCLYVPQIKPQNEFGLDAEIMNLLAEFLQHTNSCLVVFGNPYSLKYIPFEMANKALMAYQKMPEFEEQAAKIILGQAEALGELPVALER